MIGLVACCGPKLTTPARAEELYVSTLFKKAKAHVLTRCDRWFILSAKLGLVEPTEVIEPYNVTLGTMTRTERQQWGKGVVEKLVTLGLKDSTFLTLAGAKYTTPLTGLRLITPLAGLGIGKQLSWLTTKAV